MSDTQKLVDSHPARIDLDHELLVPAIDAATSCAQICTACADACLSEEMVAELVKCIRTDLDCADICAATGNVVARRTAGDTTILRAALEACATACKACGEECAQHAEMHEHCRICAEACRRCEQACRALLAAL